MGFGHPSEGKVTIDGHDVRGIRRKYLRKHISVVPQNVKLFNRSIMDNICYGSKGLDPERVREELRGLHVMRTFNTLPDGLDSVVGKNGDNLSGGQKQIVYLLRCYFRRTPIVLMDEPTSALDMGNAKYVRRMIDAMSRHSTLIVVTHDPSFANTFPVKMQMQNGRLVHSDSHSLD
jgi:ABC-type branched-subunit amino acid transport system ATPase component